MIDIITPKKRKMSNTEKALRNIITMGGTTTASIIITFIVRSVFIAKLGSEYLGLSNVFSSIISVLSISDLGMESVFAFLLYKPLVEKDYKKIRQILILLKKVYAVIGTVVLFGGLFLLPFLHEIIGKSADSLANVTLIYVIMLMSTVVTYFFSYNRIILNANQENYRITLTNFSVNTVVNVFQIILLYLVSSMVVYVSAQLIGNIVINTILYFVVLKAHPELRNLTGKSSLSQTEKQTLYKNTVGGFSNKIGSIVVFASDNVLLSMFTNLVTVGLFANYNLIIQSLTGFIQKISGTLTATIGHISVEERGRTIQVFQAFNFLVVMGLFFIVPVLYNEMQPFISVWLGHKYLLTDINVILIVFNFMLQILRLPALIFVDAFGLQWIQRWKSIIESILNVVFSLVFLVFFHMGLTGVLLGTILSTLFYVLWYEQMIVFRSGLGFQNGFLLYFIKFVMRFSLVFIPTILSAGIIRLIGINSSIWGLIQIGVFSLVISVLTGGLLALLIPNLRFQGQNAFRLVLKK